MAESFVSSSTQTGRSIRPPTAPPTSGPRVHIHTLGCKVNQVDSEQMRQTLVRHGLDRSQDPESADVIVVNTCTVTAESDKKSRKAARRFARMSHSPYVIVTGCMPAAGAEPLERLGDSIIVVSDRESVAEAILALEIPHEDRQERLDLEPGARPENEGGDRCASGDASRTRVQLKAQDGCSNVCTYCIVPRARGNSRSVSLEDLADHARRLVDTGTREIVITGIDLGSYTDGNRGLPDLVATVTASGIQRIRISSLEPMHVTQEMLARLAELPAFCRHLHLPLQSGSDRVLELMGRPYRADEYLSLVHTARELMPDIAITTDLMVGFPSETEDEAQASLDVCAAAGFSKMHVFRYSARPGTPAAEMDAPVTPYVSKARAVAARTLGREMRDSYIAARMGSVCELLVERSVPEEEAGWFEGTTRDYIRPRVRAESLHPGDVVGVRLTDFQSGTVLSELV